MNSNFNRLGNSKNPYQGSAKKVLCVCSAGLLRSPTMANVLHKEHGFNTRSCGVSKEYALVILDEVLVKWADEIVFAEQKHYDQVKNMVESKTCIILNIPDRYEYMHPELQQLILKYYDDASIYARANAGTSK